MFCKVCFDASKNGYDTHNVKDCAGNVVCPMLLNTKCIGCGYFGHTIKYCKMNNNKNNNKFIGMNVTATKKVGFNSISTKITRSNGGISLIKNNFDLLYYVSNCDDEIDHDEIDDEIDDDEIIWGVGFKSLIGKKWSDVVEC